MFYKISKLLATSVLANFFLQLLIAVVIISSLDAIFASSPDPMLTPLLAMFSTWVTFKQRELDEKNRQ